jgi:cholesterol transport system auxiliary component
MKPQVFFTPGLAIESIADCARGCWAGGSFALILAALLLGGCSVLDKPQRPSMYDFGPGLRSSAPATPQAPLPPLAIDDIGTPGGSLENMTVLYRLAYTDEQQLRPYSLARWSMPPAQLIRQRLREQLSQRRAVFNAGDSAALNRSQNAPLPLLLRIELQEFSHLFTAPETSVGLIRLRATLVEVTPSGEKLVGQRNLALQRPAASGDAPGGVRALTAATDAAIEEIDQWLQQTQAQVR